MAGTFSPFISSLASPNSRRHVDVWILRDPGIHQRDLEGAVRGVVFRGIGWVGAKKLEFAQGYSGNWRLFMGFWNYAQAHKDFVFAFLGTCILNVCTLGMRRKYFAQCGCCIYCICFLLFFSLCAHLEFDFSFLLFSVKKKACFISILLLLLAISLLKRVTRPPHWDVLRQPKTSGPWHCKWLFPQETPCVMRRSVAYSPTNILTFYLFLVFCIKKLKNKATPLQIFFFLQKCGLRSSAQTLVTALPLASADRGMVVQFELGGFHQTNLVYSSKFTLILIW